MAFKMKGSTLYGSPLKNKTDLSKKQGFGPKAADGGDDQSKQLAVSKYEMGEYKNDPTGTYKPKASTQDDKKLDRAEDARGVGKGSNRKVMKDGPVNKTQAAKIAKNKADFAKKTPAQKKAMQDAANKKRKDFEASNAYKKRKAAANKKTSQANFEPAYEGADYSKEQIKGMSKKQRKDIE
jgi:hypothetical protein